MKYRRKPEILETLSKPVDAVQWYPGQNSFIKKGPNGLLWHRKCKKCGQVEHGVVEPRQGHKGKFFRVCPGNWLLSTDNGIIAMTDEQFNAQFEPGGGVIYG